MERKVNYVSSHFSPQLTLQPDQKCATCGQIQPVRAAEHQHFAYKCSLCGSPELVSYNEKEVCDDRR